LVRRKKNIAEGSFAKPIIGCKSQRFGTASCSNERIKEEGTEEPPTRRSLVHIATNPRVKDGLRRAWKRIECVSVAAYLQALTGAIDELKFDINGTVSGTTNEFELLTAFDSAVRDIDRNGSYSVAAFRLLVAETKDMDAIFGDVEEAEA
jgi:hypothetical protein